MASRLWLTLSVAILAVFIVGCGSSETIQILHFNDFHEMMLPAEKKVKQGDKETVVDDGAGIARLANAIRERKTADTLVLFGGDMLQGTPFSTMFQGEDGFTMMNEFVDVATIGNHEFDYGQANLLKLFGLAKFDIVAGNVKDAAGKNFAPKEFVIREVKGMKIGIFGLVTEETAVTTHPKNVIGLTFEKPEAAAKRLVAAVKAAGADIVIALTHLGDTDDIKLAEAVDGIDLIVGGHSHTTMTNGKTVKNTLIVQAGYYGKNLGVVTLKVDSKAKKLNGATAKLVQLVPALAQDANIVAKIGEYKKRLDTKIEEVIAKATVKLNGEKGQIRNQETNLGNLICDITRDIARADIAMVNGGGIRTSIAAGDVRIKDIMTVLPFDNSIVIVSMTGEAIMKMFQRVAVKAPEKGNFLQISSGSSYEIKDKKVVAATIAGAPLDPARIYRVATSDFLAAGGDGFEEFKTGKTYDTGYMMRDAIIEVIKAKGSIDAKVDGRIKK